MRHYVALAIAVTIFTVPWLAYQFPDQADRIAMSIRSAGSQLAALVAHNPRTIAELQKKYNTESRKNPAKIRVLIVPGHEPSYGGAEFGALKERDLVVGIAEDLARFLQGNKKYEVVVARNSAGWNPVLDAYFKSDWNNIIEWQKAHKEESLRQIRLNPIQKPPKVHHNSAPDNVAYRLYGLTKWSNENEIDIAIHIHLNDYPRKRRDIPGEYSGFSIYTPEEQYMNGTTTRAISESVFKRLQKYNPVSDLPGESDGIVEERELIAVGANNTADAASLLIEYGYIYELQFTDPSARDIALRDLAFQTYLGLEDFFNPEGSKSLAAIYDTLVLPHTWLSPLQEGNADTGDVFALQTALLREGLYPPSDKSMNDCPRTGKIGACTKAAIEQFQRKYGIEEAGAGKRTIEELNKLYSGKL